MNTITQNFRKMKKLLFLIVLLYAFTSCRSGLDLVNQAYVDKRLKVEKTFPITDFEVYVFSICEDYKVQKKDLLTKRFCDCPENFFNQPETTDIRKVEEIYLLKHKTSDVVFYLTTFSHKYIQKKEGFLNDSTIYKNKIILEEIESIYIGNIDIVAHKISFEGNKKMKDVTFYFDANAFPEKMIVTKGNMTTSENNYSIAETIPLDDVFRNDVTYVQSNYTIDYYKGRNYDKPPRHVSEIKIVSKKGKTEVVFSFDDYDWYYKMASKRIRFYPKK